MIWTRKILEILFDKVGQKTAIALSVLLAVAAIVFTYIDSKGFEYKDVIIEYKEQAKESRRATNDCVELVEALKEELMNYKIAELKKNQYTYNSALPRFKKGVIDEKSTPIMKYVNYKYVSDYIDPVDKNISDYIGRTDAEFWGVRTGLKFLILEKQVIKTKKSLDTFVDHPFKKKEKIRLVLDPVLYNNNVIEIDGTLIEEKCN